MPSKNENGIFNKVNKHYSFSFVTATMFILSSSSLSATSIQKFTGISFANPAELMLVKKQDVYLGATDIDETLKFKGTSHGETGTANATSNVFLPYLRYAYRLNDKIIAGLDVTEPYATQLNYPKTSIVRYATTITEVSSVDLAPNIDYQFNDKLSTGAGLDILNLTLQLAEMKNTTSEGDVQFDNKSRGWGYGWHAGLLYLPTPKTRLGFTYYSAIADKLTGWSTMPTLTSTRWSTRLTMPTTALFSVVQQVNPSWIINGGVNYTWWHFGLLRFNHTALGNLTDPVYFHNTWRLSLGGRYKFNPKWEGRLGLAYAQGPTNPIDRTAAIPTVAAYIVSTGVHYHILNTLEFDLSYAYLFINNAAINNSRTATYGEEVGYGNAVALGLSWKQ